ncbi:MAG: response regulator [Magnetococcales bacterium]|nr:response regulator [Magnetococcales bacterium]
MPENSNDFVTTSRAAKLLGVSQRTIHYWLESGVINAWKTAGGHCRIPMSTINQVLNKRQEELMAIDGPVLTLLLVEDEAELREVTGAVIQHWQLPIRLLLAENGYEGLILAGLHKPDIILTDLMMPTMDGFQMIRALRNASDLNAPRIVVMTALEPARVAALGGVPDDVRVLYKPVPFDALQAIIRERLLDDRRGRYLLRQRTGPATTG